jgi:hypothetical protein
MKKYSKKSILTGAREFLEKGWCQKTYATGKYGGSFNGVTDIKSDNATAWCSYGALCAASNFSDLYCDTLEEIVEYLQTFLSEDEMLHVWNDDPSRTKDDVIELFDDAIRKWDSRFIHEKNYYV